MQSVPWREVLLQEIKEAFSYVSADEVVVRRVEPSDVTLSGTPFLICLLRLELQFLVVTTGLQGLLVHWYCLLEF